MMNYTFGYTYFEYPGTSWRNFNMHEVFGRFCFPKLFPFGLVPSYTLVYDTPASSNSMQVNGGGFAHVFRLAYDWALPALLPNTTEQVFHLTWETVYNDGVGPGNPAKPALGRQVSHCWSHQVFGISTDLPIAKNLFFVPGFSVRSAGSTGYIRIDWFTPDGLATWGDGRTFILGTEGYIEMRKYIDIAGRKGGNHLFLVNQKETKYFDCSAVYMPYGEQLVSDVVNRTETAMTQDHCFLATELALTGQKKAFKLNG